MIYAAHPGVQIRLRRLLSHGRPFVLALDDGFYEAPKGCLRQPDQFRAEILNHPDRPSAFLATIGIAQQFLPIDLSAERIIALSASPAIDVAAKYTIHSISYAIACGADAIAAHISTACNWERDTVAAASTLVSQAHAAGFPVLLATYARCEDINADDRIRAVRIAVELGADMIKTEYPGNQGILNELVDTAVGTPLLLAGGRASSDLDTEILVDQICMLPYSVGACFGRRIIYAHDPKHVMSYIRHAFTVAELLIDEP